MLKKALSLVALLTTLTLIAGPAGAKDVNDQIKALNKRLQKLELKSNKSKILWGGDLRIETHNITGETAPSLDGMDLQNKVVNSLFAVGGGMVSLPTTPAQAATFLDDVNLAIASNPAEYSRFVNNLTFDQLGQMMSGFPPAQQAALMGLLMPSVKARAAEKIDNSILYTTRLRLNMSAKVAPHVSFSGRLSMYKPWGASTQVGMFNGQPNTLAMDANSPGVPGDNNLKVDRAYFNWTDLLGQPMYLSLGRRPSTDGPPLNFRHDESRGGTPMGTVIDFQFDGATFGYHVGDHTALRACYGLGYESQYGNGTLGQNKDTILKDASFFGFNIDAWNAPDMQIQTTVARAFNLTDGFAGYVIMPTNPVTGIAMPGPIVTRFNPSVNLGDFDLASVLFARKDGDLDWFLSGSWSKSKPLDGVTTPFGGMFADPFAPVEEQTGSMYYLGARYNFNEDKTKVGLEWNKGSQYWFNFTPSQDDLIAPKTNTRGTVWEGYITHRVARKFVVRLAYITYDYDYSGSGWHLGEPKDLDTNPVLGFPAIKKASKISLGFSARF